MDNDGAISRFRRLFASSTTDATARAVCKSTLNAGRKGSKIVRAKTYSMTNWWI
jgi:hypothetical protein